MAEAFRTASTTLGFAVGTPSDAVRMLASSPADNQLNPSAFSAWSTWPTMALLMGVTDPIPRYRHGP